MVHDVEARAVELRGQRALGQRHADGVCEALTQRAGGGFNADGEAVFRMPRRDGVQLAELLKVFGAHFVARQVQQRVKQHGRVAV